MTPNHSYFADDSTVIGSHAILLEAIYYINEHGPRVEYRLTQLKEKFSLVAVHHQPGISASSCLPSPQ